MHRVSASKLHLAMQCTHPWTSGIEWRDGQSASGRLGHAIHALAERQVRDGNADVDGVALEFSLQPSQVKRLRQMWERWRFWASFKRTARWVVEKAFAIDPTTGKARLLEGTHHRDYSSAAEHEIVGTADVVDPDSDVLTVADYKSGLWVEHPADSAQMRFLSLAAARVYGAERVCAKIVRVMPDGIVELAHQFDSLDLALIDDELHGLYWRLQMPVGPTPSAAACRYCPCAYACPESFHRTQEEPNECHA